MSIRGQTTSKSLTDETSTADVTVKLLCKWYNAPLGLGQGLCAPASGRIAETTYTNSTNRMIYIYTYGATTTTSSSIYMDIDGFAIGVQGENSTNKALPLMAPVGSGSEYTLWLNSMTLSSWLELR